MKACIILEYIENGHFGESAKLWIDGDLVLHNKEEYVDASTVLHALSTYFNFEFYEEQSDEDVE